MATYILVHGGDSKGSVWDEVARLLRTSGNRVYHPTMTSIKETTLKKNIAEISALITSASLEDIILVGHSYGAMVITGVSDQLSDKIAYSVYVDSVVPEDGKSLFDILAAHGLNYKDYDLTPDQPCIDPLFFDEKKFDLRPKAYIHALQSEFIAGTRGIYETMKCEAKAHRWIYFSLDTRHACMVSQPKELAVILAGIQILL
jgi:pimeloyl-ACP methyl ester carboxylesterase